MKTENLTYYPSPADRGRRAAFYDVEEEHIYRSLEQKKPVFIKRTKVAIKTSGNDDTFITNVRQKDIIDFPQAWAVYKGAFVEDEGGTSLDKVAGVDDYHRAIYLAKGIRTAEQLADITDGNVKNFSGATRTHRDAARKLIGWKLDGSASEANAALAAMQRELEKSKAMIAELIGNKEVNDELVATQNELAAVKAQLASTTEALVASEPEIAEEAPKKKGRK